MATYTKNLNLLKPAENEKYDVNLRNENWDKIDASVGTYTDGIKKHKEANPIDHPDGSVTTPKLRDKNVTTEKLADKSVTAAKLADDINDKLNNSYVQKAGDTMQGDLKFTRGQSAIKFQVDKQDRHSITVGGTDGENLDIGSSTTTSQANLCCYNRPGWYGKDKTNTFKPFLFDDDMVITSGTVNDGQVLPVPEGFREDECHWLLSINTLNITEVNQYSTIVGLNENIKCYHENRKVVCGADLKTSRNIHYAGGDDTDRIKQFNTWCPGTANYVCICRRRFQ